jgi:cysteine desulfurase
LRSIGVCKNGVVSAENLKEALTDDVCLVSVMFVNNEIGTVNNVREIGEICKKKGVLFHTDCVQAAGCHKIDANEIQCDFLSISSHKIHGPKGVGALFVRDPKSIDPIIYGGRHQEFGLRGGTENVAGIVGFGKACEMAALELKHPDNASLWWKKLFYKKLMAALPNSFVHKIRLNGESYLTKGKILNLRIDGVDAETLVLMLDPMGVCISAGSACRSYESEPSRVLLAMGLSPDEARESVRISFSKFNDRSDIKKAATVFAECVRALSDETE